MTSPNSSHDIRALLFDLDGTLYPAKPLKWLMAAELLLLGAPSIGVLKAFRSFHEAVRKDQLADDALRYSPSAYHEQLRRAAARSGVTQERMHSAVKEWMEYRPGKWMKMLVRKSMVERIEQARARGNKTALVSDYPASQKLARMGIAHLFDVVVSSGEHPELHRMKPAPDGYLLAARTLGVAPEHCLVIGDRQDADGEAARAGGMQFELVE